jgi:hypothetical protein
MARMAENQEKRDRQSEEQHKDLVAQIARLKEENCILLRESERFAHEKSPSNPKLLQLNLISVEQQRICVTQRQKCKCS